MTLRFVLPCFGHYPSRSRVRGGAAGLRADSGGAAGLRADSGGAPPKCIYSGLEYILADSERSRADSERTLKSAADSERLRGGSVECPPRTKPLGGLRSAADSGGVLGGLRRTSPPDLNPAESGGAWRSPPARRTPLGVRRTPTESTDFRPPTSDPRLNLSRDIQHSILQYCGQMKRSLVINLNHYPHNVNSVQL